MSFVPFLEFTDSTGSKSLGTLRTKFAEDMDFRTRPVSQNITTTISYRAVNSRFDHVPSKVLVMKSGFFIAANTRRQVSGLMIA